MILLLALFFQVDHPDDPANQAIVRRKGQTSEVTTIAGQQCETNHIFGAIAALHDAARSKRITASTSMTARSFPSRRAPVVRSTVAITPKFQAVDAPSPRFDNAESVS